MRGCAYTHHGLYKPPEESRNARRDIEVGRRSVQGCVVCRKFVRLPNRPQLRAKGAVALNDEIQLDIFHWEGHRFLLVVDVATRYKAASIIEGQESEQLLNCLFTIWVQIFGPPNRVVMDQQMSLMGHETAAEFERLGMNDTWSRGPAAYRHRLGGASHPAHEAHYVQTTCRTSAPGHQSRTSRTVSRELYGT